MKLKLLFNSFIRLLVISFIITGCFTEETEVAKPKSESTVLSGLHNFNTSAGVIPPFTELDTWFFKQDSDSTYVFLFTTVNINYEFTQPGTYGLIRLNKKGLLKALEKPIWPGDCELFPGFPWPCDYSRPDGTTTKSSPWNFFSDDQNLYTVQGGPSNPFTGTATNFNVVKLNPSTGENNIFLAAYSTLNNPNGNPNLFLSFRVDPEGNFIGIYRKKGFFELDNDHGYLKLSPSGAVIYDFQSTLKPIGDDFSPSYPQPQSMWLPGTTDDDYFIEINPAGDEGEWKTRIISVNTNGVSIIKENFISTDVSLEGIYKVVPLNSGYAVIFNGVRYDPTDGLRIYTDRFYTKPAQLILLDGNFNQIGYYDIGNPDFETEVKMESNINNSSLYYASIVGKDRTLRLASINEAGITEKSLNDIINRDKVYVERISITPRKEGGFALIAWVRLTFSTRDLLFIEFDDKLNVINYKTK